VWEEDRVRTEIVKDVLRWDQVGPNDNKNKIIGDHLIMWLRGGNSNSFNI